MNHLQSDAQRKLKHVVDRIERLEGERKDRAEDIKGLLAEAKSAGLEPKIIRKLLALRKKDKEEREEEQALIDTYAAALGMLDGTPMGSYIERQRELEDAA